MINNPIVIPRNNRESQIIFWECKEANINAFRLRKVNISLEFFLNKYTPKKVKGTIINIELIFGRLEKIYKFKPPATEDKAIADKIVSGQKEIFSIFKKVSYDDLKAALETWLSPEDSNEEAGDLPWEKENTDSNKPKAAEKAPVGKTDDISKAFDDLFS